jgi:hypothetical protein
MPHRCRQRLLAVLTTALVSIVGAGHALAGTLCGTVTDRQTSAPVAHAGIFVRTQAGAYTGYYGATDLAGSFCIPAIPAGTYDVEVRVDDYQVAYLRGVIVNASSTGVDIGASPVAVRFAAPTPNPARLTTRLRWTLASSARVAVSIHDVSGRFVRGWSAASLPPGEHLLDWDLRDARGRAVGPGTYFVRLDAAGVRLTRTLVRTR